MYVAGTELPFIEGAHRGDLSGMNLAGLVRLSFELDGIGDGAARRPYATGRDIKGRGEQIKDCRRYVESRGGSYAYTYEEPDTSAYKRKRVRLPDGRTAYRVVRPVFGAALEDLKRGRTPDGQWLDGLVVYDIDRLTRDNRHLEDCIEVVEHFGRPILDITGTLDLLTDNGRTVARIVVATYNKQHVQQAVSGYGAAGEAQAPSRPPPGPPASVRTSRSVQSGGPGGGPLPQGRVDGERGGSRIGS